MPKKRTKEEMMHKTRDCSQMVGKFEKEGNKEEMPKLAWSYWKEKLEYSDGKDSENYKYNDAKNTPEDNCILEDRKKTSQVEEEQVTVEPTKMQRYDDIIEETVTYLEEVLMLMTIEERKPVMQRTRTT